MKMTLRQKKRAKCMSLFVFTVLATHLLYIEHLHHIQNGKTFSRIPFKFFLKLS